MYNQPNQIPNVNSNLFLISINRHLILAGTSGSAILTSFPGFISEADFGGLGSDFIIALQMNILNNIWKHATNLVFEGTSNLFQTNFSVRVY